MLPFKPEDILQLRVLPNNNVNETYIYFLDAFGPALKTKKMWTEFATATTQNFTDTVKITMEALLLTCYQSYHQRWLVQYHNKVCILRFHCVFIINTPFAYHHLLPTDYCNSYSYRWDWNCSSTCK